jgi:hypothetical protein
MVAQMDNKPHSSLWGCLGVATFCFFSLVGLFVGYLLSLALGSAVDGDKTTNFLRFMFTVGPLTVAVFMGIGVWLGGRAFKKGKLN